MSAPTSPSWYDVLGVDSDADAETIRTAWRTGIADLDPGNARFRSLNQAAEVLLDPASKQAYDAQLSGRSTVRQDPTNQDSTSTPPTRARKIGGAKRAWFSSDGSAQPQREAPSSAQPAPQRGSEPSATLVADRDPELDPDTETPIRTGPPVWLLIPLAILTALLVAAAAYLFVQPSDDSIASSTDDAQSAAEQAVTTILAYDYRQMDADEKASDALMTPSYAAKYDALFAQIKANAASIKPVVTAQVLDSGIVRSGDDRVQVLVFVNRPTTRGDGQQTVFHDQVRVTMLHSSSGWLVDGLQTSSGG